MTGLLTRVKLNSPLRQSGLQVPPLPLAPHGAAVILGGAADPSRQVVSIVPTPTTLFGPRGVCLVSPTGPLWVSDTGHHRLLGWRQLPTVDHQPADWVIGQPDFYHEGQNAKGEPNAATVSVPTGICTCGSGLAVADAWNHRVLIWHKVPTDSHVPADLVLGQADFSHNQPNRGEWDTAADRMHWPYGVFYHNGKLFVADTGNRRVLFWNQMPTENGQPADLVLGQPEMTLRNENGGGSPTLSSLRWPHSLTLWQGNLVVADAGNNRLLVWEGIPSENNAPARVLLGQSTADQVDINQGQYFPTAGSLNMPYGVTALGDWLITADTANSRLIGWQTNQPLQLAPGTLASALAGQVNAQSKGENRDYGLPMRDSLCWPYWIQACGEWVAIADSGNNRVLLWETNLR